MNILKEIMTHEQAVLCDARVGDYLRLEGKYELRREYGETPNGNPIGGRWVLRESETGEWVDMSTHRHDLASQYDLRLS